MTAAKPRRSAGGAGAAALRVSRAAQNAGTSLQRQICAQIREHIATGVLPAGARLPSARALAGRLRVSRNTVDGALDRLRQEGLLVRRVGAGTTVADTLPPSAVPQRAD